MRDIEMEPADTSTLGRVLKKLLDDHQRLINISMGIAVFIVIARTCLLAVPEVVPFGEELGQLLYDVSLSYATAWLFQWLVIVRPERARRIAGNRVIAPRVYSLVRPARQLVATLRGSTGRAGSGWPPRHDEFLQMCAEVRTHEQPHQFLADSWWPYLRYLQALREQAQLSVEPLYDRMDEELFAAVSAERETGMMLRLLLPLGDPANPTLAEYSDDLWEWVSAAEVIRDLHDRVLAPGYYAPDESY